MGTPAIIEFKYFEFDKEPIACVYRHFDGYPEELGTELRLFFQLCKILPDPRLHDPMYLSAKWIVYDSKRDHSTPPHQPKFEKTEYYDSTLNFLGVGIVTNKDAINHDYLYSVICNKPNSGTMNNWERKEADKKEEPKVIVHNAKGECLGVLSQMVKCVKTKNTIKVA